MEIKFKHRPGPWKIVGLFDNCDTAEVHSADDDYIACAFFTAFPPETEKDIIEYSNIKLIAAAPELLESLKELMQEMGVDPSSEPKAYSRIMQKALNLVKRIEK